MAKRRKWRSTYDTLATKYAKQHFGGWDGVLKLFPYEGRQGLKWKKDKKLPADVYIVTKFANEYHGLEKHAQQYHVTAQYEEAYHHWLMAAAWRMESIKVFEFTDAEHADAVDFALKCAAYNKALFYWFSRRSHRKTMPQPFNFGLRADLMEKKEMQAERELEQWQSGRPR